MIVKPPSVSIIIATKDRDDLLQQALEGVEKHVHLPHEIIVVETGRQDKWHPPEKAHRMFLPGASFAQANNKAARVASGDYLWLLNNDVILHVDPWVDKAYPTHGIIGARLLYPNGLIQHAGVGFDMDGCSWHLWHLAPGEHPEAMERRFPPAVTFACTLVSRHVWEQLGGLDETYINAYEDIDFCLRAREAGYEVVYEPAACATHLTSQTAGRHDHDAESWAHFKVTWLDTGRLAYVLGSWPVRVMRG